MAMRLYKCLSKDFLHKATVFLLICACKIAGNWVAIELIVVLAKSRITITVLLNCV